jgi:flagellar basal-body rod protein FlgB
VKIFDGTLNMLERSLDARLLRHEVLAGNLANADTPGFTPRDVDFAAAMARAPGSASAPSAATAPSGPAGDIPLSVAGTRGGGGPPVVAAAGAEAGLDGNAVDVDRTLAAVAENAIQYGAAARAVQKKLAMLRYAASDGSGA